MHSIGVIDSKMPLPMECRSPGRLRTALMLGHTLTPAYFYCHHHPSDLPQWGFTLKSSFFSLFRSSIASIAVLYGNFRC